MTKQEWVNSTKSIRKKYGFKSGMSCSSTMPSQQVNDFYEDSAGWMCWRYFDKEHSGYYTVVAYPVAANQRLIRKAIKGAEELHKTYCYLPHLTKKQKKYIEKAHQKYITKHPETEKCPLPIYYSSDLQPGITYRKIKTAPYAISTNLMMILADRNKWIKGHYEYLRLEGKSPAEAYRDIKLYMQAHKTELGKKCGIERWNRRDKDPIKPRDIFILSTSVIKNIVHSK